jgi:hypothetical protein
MKFGRSPANDLVLDDSSVMLFHGRFFFKSDGSLWVTDFGAGEKTTVGDLPVDEQQLKAGDLVSVGSTSFRVIKADSTDSGEIIAPLSAIVSSSDEIDLGFGPSKAQRRNEVNAPGGHGKGGSFTHRLMQVLISLLVIGVLVYVALEALKLSSGPTNLPVAPPENTLALSYERVQADTGNIFRYQLDLDEKGNFIVVVDDLINNRHVRKEKKISEPMMLQLASRLDETAFFESGSDHVGIAEGQYDLYDLTLQRNHRYHHIKVLNRMPPQEIKRAASIIEEFAKSEVRELFTILIPTPELRRYAEQSYQLGQARFAERELRHRNLAESISHFEEAMLYLETFEPKPALFEEARAGLEKATELRDIKYEDLMFKADRAMRLKDWEGADRTLKVLAELVPDRGDPRYDKIRSNMLIAERHLR